MKKKLKVVPLSVLYNPHQYKQVKSGESATLYYFKVPKGMVLFIEKIANNWFENTYYIFKIDGERVYDKLERSIASLNNPLVIKPPYVVKNYIKWEVYNNSDYDWTFTVFCDGKLYKEE